MTCAGPAMASPPCKNCGHERRVHSINGCTEAGCPCPVKYMDRDMF